MKRLPFLRISRLPNKYTRRRVFARYLYTCLYCGGHADTIDHILPLARGGSGYDYNLAAACYRCNTFKSSCPLASSVAHRELGIIRGPRFLPFVLSVHPESKSLSRVRKEAFG